MEDEAIRTDASQTEGEQPTASEAEAQSVEAQETEAPEPQPLSQTDKRAQRMKAITEKSRELRDDNSRIWAEMNGTPAPVSEEAEPEGAATEGDEQVDPAPAAEATDGDAGESAAPVEDAGETPASEEQPKDAERGWYTRDDGTRVKRLKVNGEFVELTEEQYDRAVSKELAGDQKLRLAAEMEQKLRAREEQLKQLEQQAQQPRELPQGQNAEELKAQLQKYHDAIYEGDTDAANTALMEIMQGRQTSTPNLEALVDQAATRARQSIEEERRTASVNRGWEKLQAEYPEIVSDDVYLSAADAILKTVRAENPQWEPEKVILETGRLAAEKLGLTKKAAQEEPPATSSQNAERMERKAQLKPIPKGGTTAHKAPEKPKLDMSHAAVVRRLAAGRATG